MKGRPENLFGDIDNPGGQAGEICETIIAASGVTLERIISHGQATPEGEWYDQERHEWVLLLTGGAGLLYEGEQEPIVLRPGDYLTIPAHRKHRVEWTDAAGPTVWLALHFPAGDGDAP